MRLNEGKPPWSFHFEFSGAFRVIAIVCLRGALKYSRGNWKEGLCENEILDSMGRHLDAVFYDGEIHDKEFGTHHIAHAIWNLLVLLEQRLTHGRLVRDLKTGKIEKIADPDQPFRDDK